MTTYLLMLLCHYYFIVVNKIINTYFITLNITVIHKMDRSRDGHFKHLVGIVVREIVAKTTNKNVNEVTADDFHYYANVLRQYSKGLSSAVREIFDILFRNPPKNQSVCDFVGSWIRRPEPIINVSILQCRSLKKLYL